MTGIGLRIGPMSIPGYRVTRSGFRWLHPDGYRCRAGEAIAYCTLGLRPDGTDRTAPRPFADELRDFQAVLAPRTGGRLHHDPDASRGGFLDQHQTFFWNETFEIGRIEPTEPVDETMGDPGLLRLMMAAGRRVTELADVRSGILTGWHDRCRIWWGEGSGPRSTLLAMATCEQFGILRGPSAGFLELFSEIAGPVQIVTILDQPLVPCARVVFEQMARTDRQRADIAEDLARTFPAPPLVPHPGEWIFIGALARALDRSPVTDGYAVLQRDGLTQARPAAAVLLSLNAEVTVVGRHRRLGYAVSLHDFTLAQAGPAVTQWLRTHFDWVRRSVEDIGDDYRRLLEQLRATTGARLLVLNRPSTSTQEKIDTYAGLAEPLSATLGSVRNKDLNLMLHDLSQDHDLDIVDVDALLAQVGARDHMPDGTHQSGRLQGVLRIELGRMLRARCIEGFAVASPEGLTRS